MVLRLGFRIFGFWGLFCLGTNSTKQNVDIQSNNIRAHCSFRGVSMPALS